MGCNLSANGGPKQGHRQVGAQILRSMLIVPTLTHLQCTCFQNDISHWLDEVWSKREDEISCQKVFVERMTWRFQLVLVPLRGKIADTIILLTWCGLVNAHWYCGKMEQA